MLTTLQAIFRHHLVNVDENGVISVTTGGNPAYWPMLGAAVANAVPTAALGSTWSNTRGNSILRAYMVQPWLWVPLGPVYDAAKDRFLISSLPILRAGLFACNTLPTTAADVHAGTKLLELPLLGSTGTWVPVNKPIPPDAGCLAGTANYAAFTLIADSVVPVDLRSLSNIPLAYTPVLFSIEHQ